jgi:zona occludens toxin (predicted ATPase)
MTTSFHKEFYSQRVIVYKRKQHHTNIHELHDTTNTPKPQERLCKQVIWTSRRYPLEEWDLTGFDQI